MYGVRDEGVVKRMSAVREVGKSLRRTRVSSRWGVGWAWGVPGAERQSDQASPLRKRGAAVLSVGVGVDGESWSSGWVGAVRCWVVARREGRLRSSHCVSQFPLRKSGCETMAQRVGIFVFTPVMDVSSSARWAFRTAPSQDEAVMMSLAIRLSKSAETMAGWPLMRCVSTRIPLPVGNRKLVILPMERDQSLSTFSAVMRSWIECASGGSKGRRGVFGKPQVSSVAP